jgi:pimeloyl-ACP methyl ester carboxylesterase
VAASDGTSLALTCWSGRGTPVVAVHATGFCKELWQPVVDHLTPRPPVVAPDQRGHGDSSVPPPPYDWWDLGGDLLAVVGACRLEGPLGLGHSSGATALVMAELLRPGSFSALVLVEPIVFPEPYRRMEENPMSAVALRRRRDFPSKEEAAEAFRGRGPFAGWVEPSLDAYVACGFRPGPGGWTLKCSPEIEAEFYRGATAHGVWGRLGQLGCPVVVVAGEDSPSHSPPFLRALMGQFAAARLEVVPGATHFVPMQRPGALAALVGARWRARPRRAAS